MLEIRNPTGHLIAKYNPQTGIVEIKDKQWTTQIKCHPDGKSKVIHTKT